MSAALSVRLVKRLKGFELDTAWAVKPGFTVLFGYSGAGKSLTMAMLTGMMRPDSGWIRFGDDVVYDSTRSVFLRPQDRGFGFVSQGGDLFPHMTVRRNIAFGLRGMSRAESEARVDEMLSAFHIAELAEKKPKEISGGQRQRVALARALAVRPRALLLDEPLSALDLPMRVEIRELLLATHERFGVPVVMITHDLYEAASMADTVVVYAGDGVTQVASPRELIADPATPAVRRLVHSMPLPESVFRAARPDATRRTKNVGPAGAPGPRPIGERGLSWS